MAGYKNSSWWSGHCRDSLRGKSERMKEERAFVAEEPGTRDYVFSSQYFRDEGNGTRD